MKKIEITILIFIITEAFFLLFFFKINNISVTLGIIVGLLLILLTKNIKKNIITKSFLKIISLALSLLLIYKTALFINYNLLKNYSIIIIILSLLIISIYLSRKDYHAFIKIVEIIFYLIIFSKILSLILCIPLIKINNYNFIFKLDYQFIYISLFILFIYKIIYYIVDYPIKKKDIFISFFNTTIIKNMTLLILGNKLLDIYEYPYINYLKRIKYYDFIERMEGILSFEYIFCFIITISFLLLSIKKAKLFGYNVDLVQEKPYD